MRRAALAALFSLLLTTSAVAQGYARTDGSEAWRERPDAATAWPTSVASEAALPFGALVYGERVASLTISPFGLVMTGPSPVAAPGLAHRQDGVLAVWAVPSPASQLSTWTAGDAPTRTFVVEWRFAADGLDAQLQLGERTGDITFAYKTAPRTGPRESPLPLTRLDELGGDRWMEPLPGDAEGLPRSTVFTPRAVLFNPPGVDGVPARWLDVRKESTVPDDCTKRCTYLARGRGYFHVPDRAVLWTSERGVRKRPAEFLDALRQEDRETFGGEHGDTTRWVRQVLDGKVVFLPSDGGAPLRVWFRIVEYFSLDKRGTTLADHHIWNLRWMLSNAFPGDDPREDVDRYYAWRASARARLTLGKLFRADQTDDAGKQYDSGRKNEYVLWSGRLRTGTRGALAPIATPGDGWTKFTLMEDDMRVTQHADAGDLRFVVDPNYVDGHYEYVVRALDNEYGWVTGREVPRSPLRDEPFDRDPGRETGPVTPR